MSTRTILLVLGIVLAGSVVAYSLRPEDVPAVDFVDSLQGPVSPHFDIPFERFTLTPDGLLRSYSDSGRANGVDRPVIRTRSDKYLTRDFVFEVDVTIPADVEDLAFVGFGEGVSTAPYNEPGGAFGFRIHAMGANREVRFAAISSPHRGSPVTYPAEELTGVMPTTGPLTVRIERSGDEITGSLPGRNGSERTMRLSEFPSILRNERGFLYLSNTAEGTMFSNVKVRAR